MSTREITANNFEQTIGETGIVLIDWWAPWCGPCKTFAPVFEKASEKHTDLVFGKINTDEQQELAGAFGIRSIPTLFVFRDRVLLFAQAGALPPAVLDEVIQKIRDLDMDEVRAKIAEEEAKAAAAQGGGERFLEVRHRDLDNPMKVAMAVTVGCVVIGLVITFIGLAYHHERRHHERVHARGSAGDPRITV
jgi:thioredoxin 1/thioredoxin 2